MQRVIKPKNQRSKRALERTAPKINENTKRAMIIRGDHTSSTVIQAQRDLYSLKKPEAVMFRKKNMLKPFEDSTSLEFFSTKSDCSLFVLGTHNKKRPHNLVLGRTYNHQILDMVELGIHRLVPLGSFKSSKCILGSKPCLVFTGDLFEIDSRYITLKNLLTDFFRGPEVDRVSLSGLEHAVTVTAVDDQIYLRVYRLLLKKSGSATPRVELEEMGPSLNLVLRRTRQADSSTYKLACKTPKQAKPKSIKNISYDAFGTKLGRVHMERQDLSRLGTRKMKGLKRNRTEDEHQTQTGVKKAHV